MLAKEDIEYIRHLHKEGYSIREIMRETDIPRTAVHNVVSQRADPEGIDLLRARVEELENKIRTLEELVLPKPKVDIYEGMTQEERVKTFRKKQLEAAERGEYA